MFKIASYEDVRDSYEALLAAVRSHLEDEDDLVANLANIAAFIYHSLGDINWAGFYILKGGWLVLGPFVGKPACTRIALGSGVCGAAAAGREIIVVPNVHEFPGHIACDGDTNSEIVLPLYRRGEVFGVLDVDSPALGRFGDMDKEYLGKIAHAISSFLEDWDNEGLSC